MSPPIASLGLIALSPHRRLAVGLRSEMGVARFLDLRLEIHDGLRWSTTGSGLRIEAERLIDLRALVDEAIKRT